MAISNRTATTANSGSSAAASLTINTPTGTSPGDFMIATISINNGSSATITAPSGGGWTLLVRTNNTTILGQGVYWKIAGNGEPANYQWTNTSEFISGVMNCYTGVDAVATIAGFVAKGTTTASTAQTLTSLQPLGEITYGVICGSARNTTGTTTVSTPSSGYATDGDTCTTATDFIETYQQDQHATYGLPLAIFTPGNITLSVSSTGIATIILLRPQIGLTPLAPVFVSKNTQITNAGTVAVANVQTFYPQEAIYAFVISSATFASSSSVAVSGGSLTWTNEASYKITGGTEGSLWVFVALPTGPVAAFTATATDSGQATSDMSMIVYSFLGVNSTTPIGATGHFDASTTPTVSITTNWANSWVWGLYFDSTANTSPTVGTAQTKILDLADTNNSQRQTFVRKNAITPAKSTSVTINMTAPTTDSTGILAVEIVPTQNFGRDIQDSENSPGAFPSQAPNRSASY